LIYNTFRTRPSFFKVKKEISGVELILWLLNGLNL